jgi:hypothetical protein
MQRNWGKVPKHFIVVEVSRCRYLDCGSIQPSPNFTDAATRILFHSIDAASRILFHVLMQSAGFASIVAVAAATVEGLISIAATVRISYIEAASSF